MFFSRSRLLLAVSLCLAFSRTSTAQRTSLSYAPIAADYSRSLDKALILSASPDELHVIDAASGVDSVVHLPKAPLSISVSPDGLHAAIGHDALISYVNLSTLVVESTFAVPIKVQNVALAPTYIYAFSVPPQGVESIQISTRTVTQLNQFTDQPYAGRYIASQHALYGVLGFGVIEKLDASAGPLVSPGANPTTLGTCSTIWLSPDESRIYTACATANQAAAGTTDFTHLGDLYPYSQIESLSESSAAHLIAALQSSSSAIGVTAFGLFDDQSFNFITNIQIAPTGTADQPVSELGRWIFLNSPGTTAIVISQADNTSTGAVLDRFQLASPAACVPVLSNSTATSIAQGTVGQVNVAGTPDCVYQPVSNASWVQITSSADLGVGSNLTYIVRPNPTNTARTATITLGGQTLTITQDAAPATIPAVQPLSFNTVAYDYSKSLDKLILISAVPKELHIYDPVTSADQVVTLTEPPFSVSVTPDGLSAAVGGHNSVTIVNLQTASVTQVIPVSFDVNAIVLAGNGYAYIGALGSLNIATGVLTETPYQGSIRVIRLDSSQQLLYTLGPNFYSAGLNSARWDISAGVAVLQSPPPSQPSTCGNDWLTEDGSKLVSACANVYSISTDSASDLTLAGTLPGLPNVPPPLESLLSATDSSILHTIAAIPTQAFGGNTDAQIDLFDDQSLNAEGSVTSPVLTNAGDQSNIHGLAAFFNSTANRLIVLVTVNYQTAVLSPYRVYTISLETTPGPCAISLGAPSTNIDGTGSSGNIAVNSNPNCAWGATSNASWLSITAGNFVGGPGTASFSAAPNNTSQPRTAAITIAGITYTVNQSAGATLAQLQTPAPNTTLPTGDTTFSWSAGGAGTTAYWLDIGNSLGHGDISAGQTTATAKTVSGLPCDGRTLYVRLWTQISGNWQTPSDYTFSACNAPADAQLLTPTPGSAFTSTTQTFTWSAGANGTDAYWLDIGNTAGHGDISAGQTTALSKTVSGLPCDGRTIYARLWTHLSGNWQTPIDYTFTACNAPVTAQLLTPTPGSAFTSSTQTFTWSQGPSGTDAYWLDVGNSAGHGDISAGQLTVLAKTVTNLPCDGRTIYVRLWTHLSGNWQTPIDYNYTACTAASSVAALISPTPGSTLAATQTFTWSPGPTGTDAYWLDIGNTIVHGDISAGQLTATTKTVSNLPCDGRTIYVRLWTHLSGNWQTPIDYAFTACNGAPALAQLTSPTPGSTLTTTSPTFTWSPGATGTDAYWLDIGNSQGHGDLSAGQTTVTTKTVSGLPCDGRTLYVRLWTHQNGNWQTPYDYTLTACH